jgi:hypothetical protein
MEALLWDSKDVGIEVSSEETKSMLRLVTRMQDKTTI